jgi:hypothetical protein
MNTLIKHKLQLLGMAKTWAMGALAGWCDEAHRDLIARHGAVALPGGTHSIALRVTASSMNAMQLEAALADYEARGWARQHRVFAAKSGAQVGQTKTVPPHIAHIVRLWARLGQAGKVQAATRPALLAWIARQVGRAVPNLDVLDAREAQQVTEALKAWAAR